MPTWKWRGGSYPRHLELVLLRTRAARTRLEVIRPGDRGYIEPDEEHWHGATPGRLMVHVALNEVDDEHVAVHRQQRL